MTAGFYSIVLFQRFIKIKFNNDIIIRYKPTAGTDCPNHLCHDLSLLTNVGNWPLKVEVYCIVCDTILGIDLCKFWVKKQYVFKIDLVLAHEVQTELQFYVFNTWACDVKNYPFIKENKSFV